MTDYTADRNIAFYAAACYSQIFDLSAVNISEKTDAIAVFFNVKIVYFMTAAVKVSIIFRIWFSYRGPVWYGRQIDIRRQLCASADLKIDVTLLANAKSSSGEEI